jgi:hypothetical protein
MVRVVIIRSYMHRERARQENRCGQITGTDAGTFKNQKMSKETDFGLRLNPKCDSTTETQLENTPKAENKRPINLNQKSSIPQNSEWKEFILSIDSIAESWTYIFHKDKYLRQKIETLRKQAKIQEQMAQDLDSDFNITIHDPRYKHYSEAFGKL